MGIRAGLTSILILSSSLISCDRLNEINQVLPTNSSPNLTTANTNTTPPTQLELSVHQQINQYRKQYKLPPLTLDSRISEQARLHSKAMASGKVPFSHNGFEGRVKAINRVIAYSKAAENVAFNQGYSNPAKQAVEGWIKSKGHQINIVGQYNLTGIGIVKNAKGEYYFTQIFIRTR